MTVASSTNRVSHIGNGSTTVFPFNIAFFAASDLQVYVGGVLQTLGTDYTLSGTAPYLSGSNVTFTAAPGASVPIVLVRVVPYTQLLDLVQNDSLPPEDLERRLDANVMMVQQIVEQQGRSFVIPVTDVTGTNVTLPNAAARANQALIFDGSGNVTIGALANAVISSAMQPVASAASVDAARSVMGIVGRNRIINGDFSIWQRGLSINPALSTIAYTGDRFYAFVTGASPTYARVTLNGSGGVTNCDTALQITGIASNTLNNLGQRIEAANCTDMMVGKVFTLSAWIYSASGSLSPTFSIHTAGSGDNFSTINVLTSGSLGTIPATTWTKVSATFTCTNECLKGIQAEIQLGAITAGRIVLVTGFQLESGSVSTPFDRRLFGQEFLLCQRYYETGFAIMETYGLLNGVLSMTPYFKAAKRTNPTVTVADNGSVWMTGAFSVPSVSADSFRLTRSKDGTSGHFIMSASWTANAEL